MKALQMISDCHYMYGRWVRWAVQTAAREIGVRQTEEEEEESIRIVRESIQPMYDAMNDSLKVSE